MDAREVRLTGNMVAVYHGRMVDNAFVEDMQEWVFLLRELGREELSTERNRRMASIEHRLRHHNFTGVAMAMLRQEYTKDIGWLALRVQYLDEYFSLPWYKRIFTRPFVPSSK